MLPYKRSERVGHLLKKEISDILRHRVKDPRVGFLTVVDVEVSPDLKNANVYISVLDEGEREATMEALEGASRMVRGELGHRLRMKVVPAIRFRLDTTAEYGQHIEKLLREIKEGGR